MYGTILSGERGGEEESDPSKRTAAQKRKPGKQKEKPK